MAPPGYAQLENERGFLVTQPPDLAVQLALA